MALDGWFYAVPAERVLDAQLIQSFTACGIPREEVEQVCTWRRHTGVDAWMEAL